jgi:predicted RNase H-like HicB family nuclease
MFNTIKDTTKHVYWNGHDHCYVALMSETPTCRAEGATPAEALANVDKAYARYDEVAVQAAAMPTSQGYMVAF